MPDFVPTSDGRWVSAEYARMAQIIADYDPDLELAWVPPENRELNEEYPFAVLYTDPRTHERSIALRVKETEFDHRILARLWQADNKNGNVLDRREAEDAAIRAIEMQKQMKREPVGARHNGIRLE
jgi:hypothetical protein